MTYKWLSTKKGQKEGVLVPLLVCSAQQLLSSITKLAVLAS